MLRKLELPTWLKTSGMRVITRRQLAHADGAQNITHDAKARARQMIKQAEIDAVTLRRQAMQQAFDHALRQAALPIARFLAGTAKLHSDLLKDVDMKLAARLRAAGCDPAIVQEFLLAQLSPSTSDRRLVVYVPKDYPHKSELDSRLRTRFDDIDWRESANSTSYAIEVDGQAWEVDFGTNADAATQHILNDSRATQGYEQEGAALAEAVHSSLIQASTLSISGISH